MPTSLADYGVTIFALGGVLWMVSNVLTTVLGKKQSGRSDGDNQLLQQVIANNTQALASLTAAIQEQSNTLNRHTEHIDYLRVEVAKSKGGRG